MILFVCSQGRIRSRTAEVISLLGGINARCCGTDENAIIPVNNELLRPAEAIVCMEKLHADIVNMYMGSEGKPVVSLGIRDVWNPFDPLLIDQLVQLTRLRLERDDVADMMALGAKRMKDLGIDLFNGDPIPNNERLELFF